MSTTTLQSNLVPIAISSDSGSTYKNVVCKKGWSFNHDTPVSEEQTDCGVLVGLGANSWSFDVEGVVNTTPDGSTELSSEGLMALAAAQTQVLIRTQYPTSGGGAGGDLYLQGAAYLTNLKITNQVGSLLTFSLTIKGSGTLDITP